MSPEKKLLHIAVGVVLNAKNEVLIALRPNHVAQGGLWEFPGGKIEGDETPMQALCRELKEEINIDVTTAEKLIDIPYDYTTHQVILHTFLVSNYQGEPHGLQGQALRWVTIQDLDKTDMPTANLAIVQLLKKLRPSYISAISQCNI